LFCLTLDDLVCTFCFFFFWPSVGSFTGFLLGGIFVCGKYIDRPWWGVIVYVFGAIDFRGGLPEDNLTTHAP
jgi:hypothetical protein